MIKKHLLPIFLISVIIPGCATIDQNKKARKDLARCRYEMERLMLDKVNVSGIEPVSADFDLYLRITNPNIDDVVLDREYPTRHSPGIF